MDHAAALQLIAEHPEETLAELLRDMIPEEYDDLGRYTGDPVDVLLYADAEICNGGLFQFYEKGIFDPHEIAVHFDTIEFPEMAEIVRTSIARFPDGVPPIRSQEELDPITDRLLDLGISRKTFEDLEDSYFKLTNRLSLLLAAYIRRNADHYAEYLV